MATTTSQTHVEVGVPRRRVEDPRLLRGAGQYVADLPLSDVAEVAFLRSPYAHARVTNIDVAAATAVPGVLAAWTGAQVAHVPRLPSRPPTAQQHHLSPMAALAQDVVAMVGYPVALVAASERATAQDAIELIEATYEPLPTVTSAEHALEPGAPLVYPEFGTNLAYTLGKQGGDFDAAFADAAGHLHLRLAHSRLAQVPMEPRAIAAVLDRTTDRLTVWRSTQSPFQTRSALSAVLGRPESSIHVIAPDVGGAFGSKGAMYPDELAVVLLALTLDRPVRWVSTRAEDLLFTVQGRDQVNLVDVGFTAAGQLTALRVRCIHNLGGVQLHPFATPPIRVADYATGAYGIPHYRAEGFGVLTTTSPTGPYRGAGRPEAAYVAERTIEEVGRQLGIDAVAIRRRNFIQPDQFPYTNAAGSVYDSGNYERAMDRALELSDYEAVRARHAAARAAARAAGEPVPVVGIGLATTIEPSGQGTEFGSIEVTPDGLIVARTGSSSHGQGHETSFAQVVAERLEVPFEAVRILHGDTDETPTGGGTGGSRSLVVGGSALAGAARTLRQQALELAAAQLEVSVEDLEYTAGAVQVVGVPERRLTLAQLATTSPAGLKCDDSFVSPGDPVPFAAAVAEISVDRETGRVSLLRLVAVDDCGTVVNPLIVEGQVTGGLAQGVAEALSERMVFDADGQLMTGSLLEYAVPKAASVPRWELDMVTTPSPSNPLGAKGIGESGCVAAPPAVVHAVLDALTALGLDPLDSALDLDMPLTSEKVWRALQHLDAATRTSL